MKVELADAALPRSQVAIPRERRDAEARSGRCGTRIAVAAPLDERTPAPPSAAPASVRQARVPEFPEFPEFIEHWPMQTIASDMVEFAEELHRQLAVAGSARTGAAVGLRLTLSQLDASLTRLLARSGIERDDPTGHAFDPLRHQEVVPQGRSGGVAGTIVRAVTSTWTLNGQLLRPALVVVAAAPPATRSTATASAASSSDAAAVPGR